MIVKRFVSAFEAGGVSGVLKATARRLCMPHAKSFQRCREMFTDRNGLEIGGPSSMFAWGGLIPVYPLAARIDNVNFAAKTLWENATGLGDSFRFYARKQPGQRFVGEGANLAKIGCNRYDFVLSSHMLEHTANPIYALREWNRVLRSGGGLLLVLPHRDGTFDHRRPVTTLAHLLEDYESQMGEDDSTHVEEVLRLHDISRDPAVKDFDELRERVTRNIEFRCLHHHVFDTRLAVSLVRHVEFEIVSVEPLLPYHIVIVARKPAAGGALAKFDDIALSELLRTSPFATDAQNL